MKEKLVTELVSKEITQTCIKKQKVVFRDSTIDKVDRANITFGNKRHQLLKFDVPKGSSLKGLNLKVSKATGNKYFVLSIWFDNKNSMIRGMMNMLKDPEIRKASFEDLMNLNIAMQQLMPDIKRPDYGSPSNKAAIKAMIDMEKEKGRRPNLD